MPHFSRPPLCRAAEAGGAGRGRQPPVRYRGPWLGRRLPDYTLGYHDIAIHWPTIS